MMTILKLLGEDTVKLLGGYIPPSLPGFGTPAYKTLYTVYCLLLIFLVHCS